MKQLSDGKKTSRELNRMGFVRSDDRTDDESLKRFLDQIYGKDEEFYHHSQPEIYIAPSSLFGVNDKKYVVYIRTNSRREHTIRK